MNTLKFFLFFWILFLPQIIQAHPGRTSADGCHYCRTNCDEWGVPEGERHCHNGLKPTQSLPIASKSVGQQTGQSFRSVTRVIDGDTIVLDGGEHIRLIGVDTPETVDPRKPVQYFGKEASSFTRRMAEGKKVRLEGYKKGTDKYGRSLAYVYLEDGTFLNAEIIKQGYGFAYTKFPFKYVEEFRKYQKDAETKKKGLWAD